MKKETRRINMNIPADMVERLDSYAEQMSINRTSAVMVLLSQALDSQRAINTLEELVKAIKEDEKNPKLG